MTLHLLAPAQAELYEAVQWYNTQSPGLGDTFLIEALKAFRLIEQHPLAWHRLSESTRRYRLARFPYGIVYALESDEILVVAVGHLHRAPDYWRDRLSRG